MSDAEVAATTPISQRIGQIYTLRRSLPGRDPRRGLLVGSSRGQCVQRFQRQSLVCRVGPRLTAIRVPQVGLGPQRKVSLWSEHENVISMDQSPRLEFSLVWSPDWKKPHSGGRPMFLIGSILIAVLALREGSWVVLLASHYPDDDVLERVLRFIPQSAARASMGLSSGSSRRKCRGAVPPADRDRDRAGHCFSGGAPDCGQQDRGRADNIRRGPAPMWPGSSGWPRCPRGVGMSPPPRPRSFHRSAIRRSWW